MKAVLIALAVIPALHAQLTLFAVDSSGKETPAGSAYSAGAVAAGDTRDLQLRARNTGSASVAITRLAISGSGFSIAQPVDLPPPVAPGSYELIVIHFAGGPPASYSANFQINGISLLVMLSSVAEPAFSIVNGCTGPDTSSRTIDFGKVTVGQVNTCTAALKNVNTVSTSISTLTVAGTGFALLQGLPGSLTLLPGEQATFSINFKPATAALFSGVLTVGSRMFPLTGTGLNPPLPTPVLDTGAANVSSGQQRTLVLRLPAPSPIAASGSVNLAFQPDSSLVSEDPGVVFAARGARSVPFTIQAGDTQALLGGQPGAIFQTGTSSGKIRFTVSTSATLAGDPAAEITIPPAPVAIDTASATKSAGRLDVALAGFDNTYSTGGMSFTFYDTAGRTISPGAIRADFSPDFRNYFAQSQTGSAFQMRVSFPVTGDTTQISAVDVQMTNAAGSTAVQHLVFK